jgi:acyl-CoA thioesterase
MSHQHPTHAFDQAIALRPSDDENASVGHLSQSYFNMVGPFGGVLAATLLNAVLSHPEKLGEPVSMTVNFPGPVADSDFTVLTQLIRTNRSSQHWFVQLQQDGSTAVTAMVLLAVRRDSWQGTDLQMPDNLPEPTDLAPLDTAGFPRWVNHYDMRFIEGDLHYDPPMTEQSQARTRLWVKDKPHRPLDFLALMSISDCFFPRVFLRLGQLMPAGTVSLTTYFHVDSETLLHYSEQFIFGQARAQRYYRNYFDQLVELWSADGNLLATSTQIVYFKNESAPR